MTIYRADIPSTGDVPAADAIEQQQPVEIDGEEAGLDLDYATDLEQRDANPSDVIDQAIVIPLPDDDRDVDATGF